MSVQSDELMTVISTSPSVASPPLAPHPARARDRPGRDGSDEPLFLSMVVSLSSLNGLLKVRGGRPVRTGAGAGLREGLGEDGHVLREERFLVDVDRDFVAAAGASFQ